jgi:hypothetical protein
MSIHKEIRFETEICEHLAQSAPEEQGVFKD